MVIYKKIDEIEQGFFCKNLVKLNTLKIDGIDKLM